MDDYPYVCPNCKNKNTDKCGWCGDNNNYEPKNMTLREENLIEIPEGATNGEVLKKVLKGTFPEMICVWYRDSEHLHRSITFSEDWWNSPYKAESEE